MIKMAMTERFGQYKWMQEWSQGQAFNNTFLVRKPRQQTPFIRMNAGSEAAFNDDNGGQLALMRKTFLEDEAVARYIANPAEAGMRCSPSTTVVCAEWPIIWPASPALN
jgi:hypothetical protein